MKGIKTEWVEEKQPTKEQLRLYGKLFVEAFAMVIGKCVIYGWMLVVLEAKKGG